MPFFEGFKNFTISGLNMRARCFFYKPCMAIIYIKFKKYINDTNFLSLISKHLNSKNQIIFFSVRSFFVSFFNLKYQFRQSQNIFFVRFEKFYYDYTEKNQES